MKQRKRSFGIAALALSAVMFGAFVLGACKPKPPAPLTDAALTNKVIADFTKTAADRSEIIESAGWENGEPFNAWWRADEVSYAGNKLSLSIAEMSAADKASKNCLAEYYSGEVRSNHYYGFGDFQVRMKPSKVAGTASTFFTCTGNYDKWYNADNTVARSNPHDEIDIEFLGKDTTKVQFNYFANGTGGHEYMYDLGFDASQDYHNYGYRWTENDITWFVDDKPVYKVEKANIKAGESWPTEPGRIIMNHWSATAEASAWMGEFAKDYTGKAEYLWASATATAKPDPSSTKPTSSIKINGAVVPFASDAYTITSSEDLSSMTVKYEDIKCDSYVNIKGDASAVISDTHNTFTFKVKNNGAETAKIRADIDCTAGEGTYGAHVGGNNVPGNNNFCNTSAEATGVLEKGNDYNYGGGDWFKIAAGATATITITFTADVGAKGMTFSIDSSSWVDYANEQVATYHTGELVFSEMALSFVEPPEPPTPGNYIDVLAEEVVFTSDSAQGSVHYDIDVSDEKDSMTVSYADIVGSTYANIRGDVAGIIADSNALTFKATNNGSANVTIRVDIDCTPNLGTPCNPAATWVGSPNNRNKFCNIEAVVEGAVSNHNNYEWGGGDYIVVAPGATALVTIEFTAGVGAYGISFYMDSATDADGANTYTNSVTFSEMFLFTIGAEEPAEPIFGDPVSLTFNTDSGIYTFKDEVNAGMSVTVDYTDIPQNYNNVSAYITDIAAGATRIRAKITNNTGDVVQVRADINWSDCTISATADGVEVTPDAGGGTYFEIGANGEVVIELYFGSEIAAEFFVLYIDSCRDGGPFSGSVTFSEFQFA